MPWNLYQGFMVSFCIINTGEYFLRFKDSRVSTRILNIQFFYRVLTAKYKIMHLKRISQGLNPEQVLFQLRMISFLARVQHES